MQMDDVAAMEVLKEIKSLMDSRLGDRLSAPQEGEPPPLEASLGEESPMQEEGELDPMEMEELKKARGSMME